MHTLRSTFLISLVFFAISHSITSSLAPSQTFDLLLLTIQALVKLTVVANLFFGQAPTIPILEGCSEIPAIWSLCSSKICIFATCDSCDSCLSCGAYKHVDISHPACFGVHFCPSYCNCEVLSSFWCFGQWKDRHSHGFVRCASKVTSLYASL